MEAVDRFVIYDDVTYIKGGWINRNKILVSGKPARFTVPLEGAGSNVLIKDLRVSDKRSWLRKTLKTIEQNYRRAPNFEAAFNLIESVLQTKSDFYIEVLINGLEGLRDYLGLDAELVIASKEHGGSKAKSQARVVEICRSEKADRYINAIGGKGLYDRESFRACGIELLFLKSREIRYPQFQSDFVDGLSIVDVLMFNSPDEIDPLLKAYDLI